MELSKDEIIRMAREAGFETKVLNSIDGEEVLCFDPIITDMLKDFAALVAAHEKKFWMEQIEVECNEAVLAEREACAKVCEARYNSPDFNDEAIECADAIRARGEK